MVKQYKMAEALQKGLEQHYRAARMAEVYRAVVYQSEKVDTWIVEVKAKHFGKTLRYKVSLD